MAAPIIRECSLYRGYRFAMQPIGVARPGESFRRSFFTAVVDTGAAITVLPRAALALLGMSFESRDLPRTANVTGIGGGQIWRGGTFDLHLACPGRGDATVLPSTMVYFSNGPVGPFEALIGQETLYRMTFLQVNHETSRRSGRPNPPHFKLILDP